MIPLAAVTGFADPHVRYGLRFRPVAGPRSRGGAGEAEAAEPQADRRRRSRPRRRRSSAWTPSAAARRRRLIAHDQGSHDERPDAAALRLPLFADVPAGPGPHRRGSKLPIEGVRTATCDGQTVLRIAPDALSELAFQAFRDVSHLLRPGHLAQLARDPR